MKILTVAFRQTDLSLLKRLRQKVFMSLEDASAVLEGAQVGYIVVLLISPKGYIIDKVASRGNI